MRRVLVAAAAAVVAVVLQVTVLNNLPLPGDSAPDLVLVVVVVLGLLTGPLEGALAGFGAGLATDIAPPASHLLGQSALVFCLVGYGCGWLRSALERSDWLPLAGLPIGVAAGEFLYALVGITFSDPDITWQAVGRVLPPALAYDILLSPLVFWALLRLGGYRGQPALAGLLTGREPGLAGGTALAGLGGAAGAVRDTGSGRGPRLRVAGARQAAAWGGPGSGQGWRRPGAEPGGAVLRPRAPALRLRGGVAGSAASRPPASPRLLPSLHLRLGQRRRRDGLIGGPVGATAGAVLRGAARGRSGKLRGRAFSGGQSALAPGGQASRQRAPRLRLRSRRRGDGLVQPGSPGRGSWGPATSGGRLPGKGSFRGSSFGSGLGGGGRGAGRFLTRRPRGYAAPRFRGSGRGRLRRLLARSGRRPSGFRIGG